MSSLLKEIIMASRQPQGSQQFAKEYETAVQLYSDLGEQIRELSSLNIPDRLIAFWNHYSDIEKTRPDIMKQIENVVALYQRTAAESQLYVEMARNFAEENKSVAQSVMDGERYFNPYVLLENFRSTVTSLNRKYDGVVGMHSEAITKIQRITHQVSSQKQHVATRAIEAGNTKVCDVPFAGVLFGGFTQAGQRAIEGDNPVEKVAGGV